MMGVKSFSREVAVRAFLTNASSRAVRKVIRIRCPKLLVERAPTMASLWETVVFTMLL